MISPACGKTAIDVSTGLPSARAPGYFRGMALAMEFEESDVDVHIPFRVGHGECHYEQEGKHHEPDKHRYRRQAYLEKHRSLVRVIRSSRQRGRQAILRQLR